MSTPFRRSTPGKSVPGPSPSSGDDLAHKPSSPSSQLQHGRPSKGFHTTHEEDCSTPPSSTPVAADRSPRALSVPALSARDGRQELSQVRAERSRLEDHRVEMLLGAVYCGASPHALASPTKAKLDEWRVRRANDASPGQREVGFRSPNLSDITHRSGAAMGFFGVEESRAPRFSSARRFQKMYREGEVHFYSTEGADAPAPHASWPWPASHPSTASTPGPGAYTPQYARRSKPVLPHRE